MNNPKRSCAHRKTEPVPLCESAERYARGQRQGCCPHCGKWLWPNAFTTRTDYLEAMDHADAITDIIDQQERLRSKRRRS